MQRPIRISISGRAPGTDAPSVQDVLDQIGDYLTILREVEQALADDGTNEIEWRITGASKSSPLVLELAPFPRQHGMNIDRRTQEVKASAARGLALLRSGTERPRYFTEPVLESAHRLFQRVTSGLDLTRIEFGDGAPDVEITPAVARTAAANAMALRKPKDRPYKELGSVEGYFQKIERDGYGRPLLYLRMRMDGDVVKCIVKGAALTEVERREIGEVWDRKQRLRVFGNIHYRVLGRISQIEADAVQFIPPASQLPTAADVVDAQFTGGLRTEVYLERLRRGELS